MYQYYLQNSNYKCFHYTLRLAYYLITIITDIRINKLTTVGTILKYNYHWNNLK